MSYSMQDQCYKCKKKDGCTDKQDIQDGINKCHEKGIDQGHLGGGSVIIVCQNIETEPTE